MPSESSSNSPAELLLARLLLAIEDGEAAVARDWLLRQPEVQANLARADEVLELHARLLSARGAILPEAQEGRWWRGLGYRVGETTIGGDFELVRFLGAGGMGEVWEAREARLDRSVALKLMRPDSLGPTGLERFSREARAGARLSHPGIVMTLEHRVEGDSAWIALELVPGGRTLRHFIAERTLLDPLPSGHDREVARLVAEIADALAFAHGRGVIHRDVKPGNVLMTPEGRPKVTDFGLAQILDDSLTGDDVLGTYAYMSPEQVKAEKTAIDHRTDVFSLGVVLYELLTLRKPFQGDTRVQVASKILLEDPPDPRTIRSRIPADLAVIVGKALEKDRDVRFQSMTELAADLRRHLTNEPIRAQPPTRMDRLVKWTKRHPGKTASAAIAAVTTAVITVLLVVNMRTNRALAAKTTESEKRRIAAQEASAREKEAAAEATRRADSLFRLSALQRLADLTEEADRLWPAHPENIGRYESWLEGAAALVAELPDHEAKLAELRQKARPWSAEEEEELRAMHPRAKDRARMEREIRFLRARGAVLASGEPVPEPTATEVGLDFGALPADAAGLASLAWSMVDPERSEFGNERMGLVLARRAMELAESVERPVARHTLAWALFALGNLDEAMLEEEEAVDEVSAEKKDEFEGYLARLQDAIEHDLEPEAAEKAQERISTLEAELARTKGERPAHPEWTFDDDQDKWWQNQLQKLVSGIRAFTDEREGLFSQGTSEEHGWGVKKRFAMAVSLRDGFGPDGEHAEAWAVALPLIHAAYPGLALSPQLGLVPLGPDPRSELWEFAHLETGEVAARGPGGRLAITGSTGLVFVLLPGARFLPGAQKEDPRAPRYDPDAMDNEKPLSSVTLAPFFMSKYEMTQAQWMRVAGANPSYFAGQQSETLPVEQVSWSNAVKMLGRLDLGFPTEAQWEYGARGGTETPWYTGENPASLIGAANLADQSCKRSGRGEGWEFVEWDDGFVVVAPVGQFTPNPFGLHDTAGNVWEMCADLFGDYGNLSRGTGERLVGATPRSPPRVTRGGDFMSGLQRLRVSYRDMDAEDDAFLGTGIRPVKLVPPRWPEGSTR